MIGLDTNILVRYITQDNVQQAQCANSIIEHLYSKTAQGYIAQILLCELISVLQRAYGNDKQQVVSVLDQVLVTIVFSIENEDLARRALEVWRHGVASYSGYLLVLPNQFTGGELTDCFNLKLAQHPEVAAPP